MKGHGSMVPDGSGTDTDRHGSMVPTYLGGTTGTDPATRCARPHTARASTQIGVALRTSSSTFTATLSAIAESGVEPTASEAYTPTARHPREPATADGDTARALAWNVARPSRPATFATKVAEAKAKALASREEHPESDNGRYVDNASVAFSISSAIRCFRLHTRIPALCDTTSTHATLARNRTAVSRG